MSNDAPANADAFCIPASAAEAWAAVYIDVAEKLDAEQQQQATRGESDEKDREVSSSSGEVACPSI